MDAPVQIHSCDQFIIGSNQSATICRFSVGRRRQVSVARITISFQNNEQACVVVVVVALCFRYT